MIALYYLAPLDRQPDARAALWLAVGLVALVVAVVYQAGAIAGSETPRLRAIETVTVGLPALLLLDATAYVLMSYEDSSSFSEHLSRTDALYFTMTVFTTVGFGDITPVQQSARIVTMTQMVVGLLAVGVVARRLLGAVHKALANDPGGEQRSLEPLHHDHE